MFYWAPPASRGRSFRGRFTAGQQDLIVPWKERSEYVRKKYQTLLYKNNNNYSTPLLAVIGDSYSQDFVNIIFEAGAFKNYTVITYYIPKSCQLYFEDDRRDFIEESGWKGCENITYDTVNEITKNADIIIFAFSWFQWAADNLGNTLEHIKHKPGSLIYIIGGKGVGRIQPRRYLDMSAEEKAKETAILSDELYKVNAILGRQAGEEAFVDILGLVEGEKQKDSPIFTDEGLLIYYDGHPLTKAGAQYLGQKIPPPLQIYKQ